MPVQFFEQELTDTLEAINGYYDERIDTERITRRQTVLTLSALVGSDHLPEVSELWPIAGDKEMEKESKNRISQRLLDTLKKKREEEALRRANEKLSNAGTTT